MIYGFHALICMRRFGAIEFMIPKSYDGIPIWNAAFVVSGRPRSNGFISNLSRVMVEFDPVRHLLCHLQPPIHYNTSSYPSNLFPEEIYFQHQASIAAAAQDRSS